MSELSQFTEYKQQLEEALTAYEGVADALVQTIGELQSFATEVENGQTTFNEQESCRAQKLIEQCSTAMSEFKKPFIDVLQFLEDNSDVAESYISMRTNESKAPNKKDGLSFRARHDKVKAGGLKDRADFARETRLLIQKINMEWNLKGKTALKVPEILENEAGMERESMS
ncbi:hypothetical protein NliqN6_5406 [Naganishia liquefaciens]|uniref:Uncharacterized protein n=1 Tax=Naganishia liquefaciens TaxID=104408 RepID=A0A8H3YGQ1_9TREE|nr:hypothetical protein NliqN6_5406 [Naganishia liquefaciens]